MDNNPPRSRKIMVDGEPESLIVYFRDGARIVDALELHLGAMGRAIVYVGEDGLPVALQFIDPLPDVAPEGRPPLSEEEDTRSRTELYDLSCKMIATVHAQREIARAQKEISLAVVEPAALAVKVAAA